MTRQQICDRAAPAPDSLVHRTKSFIGRKYPAEIVLKFTSFRAMAMPKTAAMA
jgi:hypothetical protein